MLASYPARGSSFLTEIQCSYVLLTCLLRWQFGSLSSFFIQFFEGNMERCNSTLIYLTKFYRCGKSHGRYHYKILKKNYLATPPPLIVRWRKNGPFSDWFLGKPLFYILGIARLGGEGGGCKRLPGSFLSTSKWAISCSRVRALAKMICALFSSLQQRQKTEAGFPYLLRLTFDLDTWCGPSIIAMAMWLFERKK